VSPQRPGFASGLSPCDICGGPNGTGRGFSPNSSISPVSIIPSWLSMFTHQLVAAVQRQSHSIDMSNNNNNNNNGLLLFWPCVACSEFDMEKTKCLLIEEFLVPYLFLTSCYLSSILLNSLIHSSFLPFFVSFFLAFIYSVSPF
jgi:hypothetical protein